MIDYDARSLVPDLVTPLREALGVADERRQKREKEEAAGLASTMPTTMDALLAPANRPALMRLAKLNPQLAQTVAGLAQAGDQHALAKASQESELASRTYQAFLDIKNPAERNKFLAKTITDMDAQGHDTGKLRDLIGLNPDQQTLRARAGVIMAGDVKSLTDSSTQHLMNVLKLQGQQLENIQKQQGIGIAAAEEKRKADEAATKKQDAAAAVAKSNQDAISGAQGVNSQINQVLGTLPGASSGWTGRAAALMSPAGDTARKARALATLKSMLTFDKLMDMKRNSPTGASGLGSTSENELSMLASSIANLDPSQSDEDLAAELEKVRGFFSNVSQGAGGGPLVPLSQAAPQGSPVSQNPANAIQIGRFTVVPH